MGKGSHRMFKTSVNEITQNLPPLGKSGWEVFHLIPEPIKFSEVTKLSENKNKPRIKSTQKDIKNRINNHNFLVEYPKKG